MVVHALISRFPFYYQVCKSLGLLEKEYFGLQYEDKGGETLWVNLRNPLHEQIPMGSRIIMEMRVKYFIQPHKILQPVTRCVCVCVCVVSWMLCSSEF